ncbi:MAG: carbohydrate-binding family 9-like protein [Pyrinomonadaceae bacterium]
MAKEANSGFVKLFLAICCFSAFTCTAVAQRTMPKIKIPFSPTEIQVEELDNETWSRAVSVSIGNYWSGKKAPKGRQFKAQLLWSNEALYVRFVGDQAEPLIVSSTPELSKKTIGLWDRDVCEIFVAPNKANRNKYFEFEIAPTGEWIDLGIEWSATRRKTDLEYASGMESAVHVETDKIVMAVRIPWKALGRTPKPGDIWLGNIFRCIGKDPTRGYLAWQPTKTEKPNFHVPSAFGEFEFCSECKL